jgi:hypothetical protein
MCLVILWTWVVLDVHSIQIGRPWMPIRIQQNEADPYPQDRLFTVSGNRIRMFLSLPDPDPLVRGPAPDPSLLSQKS